MILKDSSLASTITVAEMTRAGQLIAASTFQNTTVYTMVALLYLALSLPLIFGVNRLERYFGKSAKGQANDHDRQHPQILWHHRSAEERQPRSERR
ncbi:hypothetical protein [Billgrantia tianxiuensis]|uniref:hypothetical protein n=1 Tax=Billgrantia tianxiuensis TaxID=2497861 RepID=UPI001F18C684|nr:hypothetical protein [Halomonas tianxiuensis]